MSIANISLKTHKTHYVLPISALQYFNRENEQLLSCLRRYFRAVNLFPPSNSATLFPTESVKFSFVLPS